MSAEPVAADAAAGYPPIGDYAAIGDGRTMALVSRHGSIDWCCMPDIDAPAVFCKLLDRAKGGSFRVAPAVFSSTVRRYVDDTNVLETEYATGGGRVRVTDFMPVAERVHDEPSIMRIVEGLDGLVDVEVFLRPTFDFARGATEIVATPGGARASGAGQRLTLSAAVDMAGTSDGVVRGVIPVGAGERVTIALSAGERAWAADAVDRALEQTMEFWAAWMQQCTYDGPYRELVRRSALVLKLLSYRPTGAVVAAPTTSLPEDPGGERNWDYRYTWLRDGSLILYALQSIGYHDEADAFFGWFEDLCVRCRERLQIMYTVAGGEDMHEHTLDHLEGYRGSRPVRVGNAAATQTQLDIYGGVVDAAYLHVGAGGRPLTPQMWDLVQDLVERAARRWVEPDEGIWEVRGPARHFLYSKLLCWVALDRGIRIARAQGLPADLDRWEQVREEIRDAILTCGYDGEVGAFTQSFGSPTLDASALVVPLSGLLPANDPRVRSTVAAIQQRLTSSGLVYRYRTSEAGDGLAGDEATFALCSFWLVDNLAMAGQIDAARELFERVTSYANDVGLLAEEIDPVAGELLGNFPQGFTHLGLIRAALSLAEAECAGAAQPQPDRPQPPPERES